MFQSLGGGPQRFFFQGLVALHEFALGIDQGSFLAHRNERRTRPRGSSDKTGRPLRSRTEPTDQKIPIRHAPKR